MADTNDDFEFEVENENTAPDAGKPDIEVEDDTPEEDRGREPLPKEIVEELEKDELEDYSDKVKTRLKQMKKVWHDERREKERALREQQEAISMAQRYRQEVEKLRNNLTQGEQTLIQSVQQATEYEIAEARRAYKEAYESGDSDKVIEAQEKLAEANYKLNQLKSYKPVAQNPEFDVEVQQEQFQVPKPDQKTMAWQERNQWYGTDEEMTATALGLHQKLIKQYGADYAGTDNYWQNIDTTMQRRFPEYFGESEKPSGSAPTAKADTKPATVVAPASRSTSSKKIVLKQSQISLAKKLGLTPEQYARELSKMER